jgi:hypothetical protein
LQPRRFTVIAGQVEDHEKIALVHVEGNDLADVHENAILTLKRNVADREWEVLYTFPGLIEPEEYFLEETDDVRELNDRLGDVGRSSGEQRSGSVSGAGEV